MTAATVTADNRRREDRTQLGNSYRFARLNRGKLIYVSGVGWLHWTGKVWAHTSRAILVKYADRVIDDMASNEARKLKGDEKAAFLSHVAKSSRKSEIWAMIDLAEKELLIPASRLDADPQLLNTQTCIVDLRTGETMPHSPDFYMTKITAAEYAPDVDYLESEFIKVLLHALPDPEVYSFFQFAAGYSLTGLTCEDTFMLVSGPTQTSKSTVLNAMTYAMGDYAGEANPKTFADRGKESGEPQPFIVALRGLRLVTIPEMPHCRLDVALVKTLAGGDRIQARGLKKDPIRFTPHFVAWVATNDPPRIDPNDDAIWRRIRHIEFLQRIPDDQKDERLRSRLKNKENAAAILRWAVDGAMAYNTLQKLEQPAKVRDAGQSLRDSQDVIGRFLAERCRFGVGNGYFTPSAILYARLQDFCQDDDEPPPSKRALAHKLKSHGCNSVNRGPNGGRGWEGVEIERGTTKLKLAGRQV